MCVSNRNIWFRKTQRQLYAVPSHWAISCFLSVTFLGGITIKHSVATQKEVKSAITANLFFFPPPRAKCNTQSFQNVHGWLNTKLSWRRESAAKLSSACQKLIFTLGLAVCHCFLLFTFKLIFKFHFVSLTSSWAFSLKNSVALDPISKLKMPGEDTDTLTLVFTSPCPHTKYRPENTLHRALHTPELLSMNSSPNGVGFKFWRDSVVFV